MAGFSCRRISPGRVKQLFRSLFPLLLALFLVIALKVDLVYSFVLTIAVLWIRYRISLRDMGRLIRKSISIEMALMDMMLSYASGYCGVILSPMHLCLILTKDYFKAGLNGVYRLLWLPATSVFCVGLIITLMRE